MTAPMERKGKVQDGWSNSRDRNDRLRRVGQDIAEGWH